MQGVLPTKRWKERLGVCVCGCVLVALVCVCVSGGSVCVC